jgi:hypothetical protein
MTKKDNPFKKAIDNHKQEKLAEESVDSVVPEVDVRSIVVPEMIAPIALAVIDVVDDQVSQPVSDEPSASVPKKRGRPATGKRSDDLWTGRTYYIQRETDLDIEDQLLQLKRSGVDIDKSELVDFLLAAWVKLQKGEKANFRISEISPIRK